jgi:hypothetical protein
MFPPFKKGAAPAKKTAGKGNPFAKAPAKGGKMCPGCKNPACKKAGKCAK